MPTIFNSIDALNLFARYVYGRPGATSLNDTYIATASWDEFFNVNERNTAIFVAYYDYDGPFEELEPWILKNPYAIIRYAISGLKGPWPAGEAVLLAYKSKANTARVPQATLVYYDQLRQPDNWVEFEKYLSDLTLSVRLKDGEMSLVTQIITAYCRLANQRVTILEEHLYANANVFSVIDYLKFVGHEGEVPTFEARLITNVKAYDKDSIRAAILYTVGIRKTRWPDLEALLDPYGGGDYATYLVTMIPDNEHLVLLPREITNFMDPL